MPTPVEGLPPAAKSVQRVATAESRWPYPKRALFAAGVAVSLVLLWQLADVLVLTFGAIVIAAIVRGLARRLEGRFGLTTHASGIVSTVSILALLGKR